MKRIILIMLVLLSAPLQAGELSLQLSGKSHHDKPKQEYNEENYGAGITYQVKQHYIAAGFYKNSDNRTTKYLLTGWRKDLVDGDIIFAPGVVVGGLTGYKEKTVTAIMPTLTFGYQRIKINTLFLPAINGFDRVIFMQLEITLGGKP